MRKKLFGKIYCLWSDGFFLYIILKDILLFSCADWQNYDLCFQDGSTKKRATGLDPSVFICITLLGYAVKNEIEGDVKELLEPMLSTGLSSSLTIALRELAKNIPSLKKDISEGMFAKLLSNFLYILKIFL